MAPQAMIPRCRTVGRSTIAAGLDLSPRRRHTRTRRLSLDKQKRDSSENTTLCHSVIHVDLARHHSKRWRLFGGCLAFLIKNLYYEDIAANIPNISDHEAQGIKVYLNQNKAINIYNMYHPSNNKLIDDGKMAQFLIATNDENATNPSGDSYQISSKIKFEIKDKKVEKKGLKD
ncbi:hypothetical protein LAZ67_3002577 [Cordylochernes scorpioides]|uniref:Uncharacterized protein n=1 Tax=Cordylochernes scorpioides TaxID=51811 RepID=A0ABY6KCL7_9ARAC|nr:hypothetical protein LAZ67_3002577 [Cordylochernes scorpioides]